MSTGTSRRALHAAGLSLLALSLGCDLAIECTLIGCTNGLIVQLTGQTNRPFRVEIQANSGSVNIYECTSACTTAAVFEDYFPQTATIKVITTAGTTTTNVTPVYTESQPNGERCGPTCRHATVTVPFPTE